MIGKTHYNVPNRPLPSGRAMFDVRRMVVGESAKTFDASAVGREKHTRTLAQADYAPGCRSNINRPVCAFTSRSATGTIQNARVSVDSRTRFGKVVPSCVPDLVTQLVRLTDGLKDGRLMNSRTHRRVIRYDNDELLGFGAGSLTV